MNVGDRILTFAGPGVVVGVYRRWLGVFTDSALYVKVRR